jgi:hypothetical protein
MPRYSTWFVTFSFSDKNYLVYISYLSHTCYMSRLSVPLWYDHHSSTWMEVQGSKSQHELIMSSTESYQYTWSNSIKKNEWNLSLNKDSDLRTPTITFNTDNIHNSGKSKDKHFPWKWQLTTESLWLTDPTIDDRESVVDWSNNWRHRDCGWLIQQLTTQRLWLTDPPTGRVSTNLFHYIIALQPFVGHCHFFSF